MKTLRNILFIIAGGIFLTLIGGYIYYRTQIYPDLPLQAEDRSRLTLMPLPAKAEIDASKLYLGTDFQVEWKGYKDERLERALLRFQEQLGRYTFASNSARESTRLKLSCQNKGGKFPSLDDNESYNLEIGLDGIDLVSSEPAGLMRGLETLLQMLSMDEGRPFMYTGRLDDHPRFPWRGLMLDVSRHFIPKDIILRILDAMAAVKLNVFHWHLTDYQGFRLESKVYPKLHEEGSDGDYYTQEDLREIIEYAADRAIRIVPEFDVPGHSTSWLAGYPELAATASEYEPDTLIGILDPIMDPRKEEVYEFLDKFLEEMTGLFPDPYIHIGGDEVSTKHWNESKQIQAFMREQKIEDNEELQAYFNRRLKEILKKHNRKMIGWDEVFHPEIGNDIVIQSWRSHKSLYEVASAGLSGILSSGYYLDHKLSAAFHYQVDPEVLPGGVNIEPDSNLWQTWKLQIATPGEGMEGEMSLFGSEESYRGFISTDLNTSSFSNVEWEAPKLSFPMTTQFGELSFEASIEGDSMTGKMSLGLLNFDLKGEKIAANDMEGTDFPVFEVVPALTDSQYKQILGGEACLWTEVVDARTVESRLWPRTAAIAEKLWSPQSLTNDLEDMYRRLYVFSDRLNLMGIKHQSYQDEIIGIISDQTNVQQAMVDILKAIEEAKYYNRFSIYETLSTNIPLTRFADAALPENYVARDFNLLTEQLTGKRRSLEAAEEATELLEAWINQYAVIDTVSNPKVKEIKPVSQQLFEAANIALEALNVARNGEFWTPAEREQRLQSLTTLQKEQSGVIIAVYPGFINLVEAVPEPSTE